MKKKIVVKVRENKRILEIIIPPGCEKFIERFKSYIEEFWKPKGFQVEFQEQVEVKRKKGDDGLYKLRLSITRVKFDGGQGVVISIATKDGDYQDEAVINKKRGADSVIGIRLDDNTVIKRRMSELEIITY